MTEQYNYLFGISPKHKVFISYHHANDQYYKNALIKLNEQYGIFIDASVDTGEIDDNLPDETIRQIIRDDFLRDSTVTILLVGTETKGRKHIDWELYSSMFDGKLNKKSGILVINLPSVYCDYYTATHDEEKERVYPETTSWLYIDDRSEYEKRYPYMPERIIDNLLAPGAKISVTPWNKLETNPETLRFLIDAAYKDKAYCKYDLSRTMRRKNA
jgi:hypothetical protein